MEPLPTLHITQSPEPRIMKLKKDTTESRESWRSRNTGTVSQKTETQCNFEPPSHSPSSSSLQHNPSPYLSSSTPSKPFPALTHSTLPNLPPVLQPSVFPISSQHCTHGNHTPTLYILLGRSLLLPLQVGEKNKHILGR